MSKKQQASTASSKRICMQGENVAANVSLICGIAIGKQHGEFEFSLSIEVSKDYTGRIPTRLLRSLVSRELASYYGDDPNVIPSSAREWGELIDILRINTSQPTEV